MFGCANNYAALLLLRVCRVKSANCDLQAKRIERVKYGPGISGVAEEALSVED